MDNPPAINPADHIKLAMYYARQRIARRGLRIPTKDSEEFSDACYALVRAAKKFQEDHESGSQFVTYASHAIWREFSANLIRDKAEKRTAPGEIRRDYLEDIADHRPEGIDAVDAWDALQPYLDLLKPRSKRFVVAHFIHGKSYNVIAKCEKIDPEYVRQIIVKSMRTMQASAERDYLLARSAECTEPSDEARRLTFRTPAESGLSGSHTTAPACSSRRCQQAKAR